MQLKSLVEEVDGLRYIVDNLDIKSSVGRRMLLSSEFMTEVRAVEDSLNELGFVVNIARTARGIYEQIAEKLIKLRDIKGTISNLKKGQTLDDIELFEIKHLALLSLEVKGLTTNQGVFPFEIVDLSKPIEILDPEKSRIPSFYIYDSYSPTLCTIRKQLKAAIAEEQHLHLLEQMEAEEDAIRTNLSEMLRGFAEQLDLALKQLGKVDMLIAKAFLTIQQGFCKPTVSNNGTSYCDLFNPCVREFLKQQNRSYQPIDISLNKEVVLISGANMAGKTVILKTLSLCQHLVQLGFFVPASLAEVSLVHRVMVSIGDAQSEQKGLSAFAAEILGVSRIVAEAKKHSSMLVLIDELARTTNPTEGKAIVGATANLLNNLGITAVITTHYSGVASTCRKLRVKGFVNEIGEPLTLQNIGSYVDYSLTEDLSGEAPQEAVRIAKLLGVDNELVDMIIKELKK